MVGMIRVERRVGGAYRWPRALPAAEAEGHIKAGLVARFAATAADVKAGLLDGLSVGVEITDYTPGDYRTGEPDAVVAAQLREVSLTGVPAFDDARVTALAAQYGTTTTNQEDRRMAPTDQAAPAAETVETAPDASAAAVSTFAAPAATTAAPAETTTTAPPLTLPPTLPPTLPSQTTLPVVTAPPVATGALFNVTSLVDIFNAPAGFSIVDSDPQSTQAFVDVVAAVPALNEGIAEMGVGVLIDNADGTAIATLVVGIAISDSMPAEWKDLLCGTSGVLQTSDQGFTGIQCPGTPGTGVSDIFTLTEGDIGVSIASVIQGIPAAAVADAFFTANF